MFVLTKIIIQSLDKMIQLYDGSSVINYIHGFIYVQGIMNNSTETKSEILEESVSQHVLY